MHHKISHFSQYNPTITKQEQNKSCGICCVKMMLDFLHPESEHNIIDIINEATIIGAFNKNIGGGLWTHDGLVKILRNHGVLAYPQEFKTFSIDLKSGLPNESKFQNDFVVSGLEKIKARIREGRPTIVSVTTGFNQNKDDHMIIVNGFEDSTEEPIFYITDPQDETFQKVAEENFLKHWKKLAIFID